jgi:hypothetical protein
MPRSELAHLELLAEVDSLIDRLDRWAQSAPAWQPAEKCRALVRRLTERAASLRVRIEAPLVVATLGGTGTGKSALVNAIVGAEVVQTGRARPTTIRPTLISRPGLTPELLGIDPASVQWIERDLPALRDLVIVDCPDPDTTEEDETTALSGSSVAAESASHSPPPPGSNLARLRAILPKCDVLLVATTQQKYRSARVADELAAAAPGAHLVFVQTHADLEDDIRDDWRKVLATESHIFRVDSLRALADAQQGLQPRGEFAELLDLLTRQMAGAAGNRIRRANFLDLVGDTLDACRTRIDQAMPKVREVQTAIDQQRAALSSQIAGEMQTELLTNRRQWENRLLGKAASRWGLSPFTLVLRTYQGVGGLLSGALLYRARTPAQMALWGALEGIRTWRKHRETQQATQGVSHATAGGFESAELRKASIIVEGYVAEAGLSRGEAQWETVAGEAAAAAGGFVARVSTELESLIGRLAQRHTGWFTRFRYEILLLAMLGMLLYRLGKNFFYDSWLADQPSAVYGFDFYVSAGFWLVLWCLVLLWAFCSRLRRGLRGEIGRLAAGWQDGSAAAGIFARVENECVAVDRFRQELDVLQREVEGLQRQVANCGR